MKDVSDFWLKHLENPTVAGGTLRRVGMFPMKAGLEDMWLSSDYLPADGIGDVRIEVERTGDFAVFVADDVVIEAINHDGYFFSDDGEATGIFDDLSYQVKCKVELGLRSYPPGLLVLDGVVKPGTIERPDDKTVVFTVQDWMSTLDDYAASDLPTTRYSPYAETTTIDVESLVLALADQAGITSVDFEIDEVLMDEADMSYLTRQTTGDDILLDPRPCKAMCLVDNDDGDLEIWFARRREDPGLFGMWLWKYVYSGGKITEEPICRIEEASPGWSCVKMWKSYNYVQDKDYVWLLFADASLEKVKALYAFDVGTGWNALRWASPPGAEYQQILDTHPDSWSFVAFNVGDQNRGYLFWQNLDYDADYDMIYYMDLYWSHTVSGYGSLAKSGGERMQNIGCAIRTNGTTYYLVVTKDDGIPFQSHLTWSDGTVSTVALTLTRPPHWMVWNPSDDCIYIGYEDGNEKEAVVSLNTTTGYFELETITHWYYYNPSNVLTMMSRGDMRITEPTYTYGTNCYGWVNPRSGDFTFVRISGGKIIALECENMITTRLLPSDPPYEYYHQPPLPVDWENHYLFGLALDPKVVTQTINPGPSQYDINKNWLPWFFINFIPPYVEMPDLDNLSVRDVLDDIALIYGCYLRMPDETSLIFRQRGTGEGDEFTLRPDAHYFRPIKIKQWEHFYEGVKVTDKNGEVHEAGDTTAGAAVLSVSSDFAPPAFCEYLGEKLLEYYGHRRRFFEVPGIWLVHLEPLDIIHFTLENETPKGILLSTRINSQDNSADLEIVEEWTRTRRVSWSQSEPVGP